SLLIAVTLCSVCVISGSEQAVPLTIRLVATRPLMTNFIQISSIRGGRLIPVLALGVLDWRSQCDDRAKGGRKVCERSELFQFQAADRQGGDGQVHGGWADPDCSIRKAAASVAGRCAGARSVIGWPPTSV